MQENNNEFNKPKTFIGSIREINAKYRTPRIPMTPIVKISLYVLRFYLIAMLLILLYKFIITVIH